MKKLLFILSIIILSFSSCVTNQLTQIPNSTTISSIPKDRIEILGETEGNSVGVRVWLTFIPVGWANTDWVKSRSYKKALKKYPNAHGLIDQSQNYHKTTVPLIVVTPQVKRMKTTGVAYRIKTEEEMNN